MQAVILAGGLGTRLRPLTTKVPKAMVSVNGRPFLEYELELLRSHGVNDIIVCVGYLGEKIKTHFGDGSKFGVQLRYSSEGNRLLGPIGALKLAERLLRNSFFVTYGDAYLRLDYGTMLEALEEQEELALMAVYRNEGRFGRSDVVVKDGFVTAYDKVKSISGMDWINFGVTALKRGALSSIESGRVCDEMNFYGGLVAKRQLRAFEVWDRFYEIGSTANLKEFGDFISKTTVGTVTGQSAARRAPAIPACVSMLRSGR